jgi:hypothetical protein
MEYSEAQSTIGRLLEEIIDNRRRRYLKCHGWNVRKIKHSFSDSGYWDAYIAILPYCHIAILPITDETDRALPNAITFA